MTELSPESEALLPLFVRSNSATSFFSPPGKREGECAFFPPSFRRWDSAARSRRERRKVKKLQQRRGERKRERERNVRPSARSLVAPLSTTSAKSVVQSRAPDSDVRGGGRRVVSVPRRNRRRNSGCYLRQTHKVSVLSARENSVETRSPSARIIARGEGKGKKL